MTSSIYQGWAVDQAGDIIPEATITVRDNDTNAIVDLWSNRATTSTKTNPLNADANGYFFFYRTAGRYKIEISDGVDTVTLVNVQLGTASEHDVGTDANDIPLISDLADIALTGEYDDLLNKPALGTAAFLDAGTGSGEVRTNTQNDGRFLRIGNNLNDLENAGTARSNLGLGSMAVSTDGVSAGAIPLKIGATTYADSPITVDGNGAGPVNIDADVDMPDNHLHAGTVCAGLDIHEINFNGTTYSSDLASAESGGTNAAQTLIQRWADGATSGPRRITGRSRGTNDTPAVVQNDDVLFEDWVLAYDGTNFRMGGRIRWLVDGTVSTGVIPAELLIQLCDSGGALQTPVTVKPNSMDVTQLNADNLRLDGNTLSSTAGGIVLAPSSGNVNNRHIAHSAPGSLFISPKNEDEIGYVGKMEITSVECVADVAGSLNEKYFRLYGAAGTTSALDTTANEQIIDVWFDVDGGGSAPTTGAGRMIEVDIAANDTAEAVALAISTALNADAAFSAGVDGQTVYVAHVTPTNFSDASAGDSGFTVAKASDGSGSLPGSIKWMGGVLAPNGCIYGMPRDSTTILKIDPTTDTATTFGSLSGSGKWAGGVLAPNGCIYGIPYGSTAVLKISTEVNTVPQYMLSAYLNKL